MSPASCVSSTKIINLRCLLFMIISHLLMFDYMFLYFKQKLTYILTYYGSDGFCQVISDSCDLVDCRPPGSSVHGISQARILEWVAISFCRGSS